MSKEIVRLTENLQIGGIVGEIITAASNLTIFEAKRTQSFKAIQGLVKKTVAEAGHNKHEDDIKVLMDGVADDVYRDFQDLTCEELAIAYRLGVRGEFGEFMGLSVITFHKWGRSFREMKNEQIHALKSKLPALPEPAITDQKRRKIRKEFINSIIDWYKKFQDDPAINILDAGNRIYKTLSEIGLITIDKDLNLEKATTRVIRNSKIETNQQARKFKERAPEEEDKDLSQLIRDRSKDNVINILQGQKSSEVEAEAMNLTLRAQFEFWDTMGDDVPLLIFEAEKNFQNNVDK